MVKLFPFQEKGLKETEGRNKVAYYYDMGLGKTFVGAEKMMKLGKKLNLVICQKSKIQDWVDHFHGNYEVHVLDLTCRKSLDCFVEWSRKWIEYDKPLVGIINYELAWRRPELSKLKPFTLMLDESSLIQNENSKRSRFVLKKLHPENIILLSGTPTSGRYERLWSQLHLLGWDISKELYWNQYVDYEYSLKQGFPIKIVKGYKNVERLKKKMREYGCQFLKTEEVFDLPEQIFTEIKVDCSKEYKKFRKSKLVTVDSGDQQKTLVGDTILTSMLYGRMLCGHYNKEKLDALKDLLNSTEDRVLVFYNFNEELRAIEDICLELDKPLSIVNGMGKDLSCYDEYENSVTAIQYQSGAMGLNLQKANKIVYFTPPTSSELFEQSKKRIHRIGQNRHCFYYEMICRGSIEEKIYRTLAMRRDYANELFKMEEL